MKGVWLQALSGFSNNEGGVLVWGLDARKDKTSNIDQIVGVKPINDPQGLRAKLLEWRRQATDPPVGNVQVQAYDHPTEAGKGFVVCFIPKGRTSRTAPTRATGRSTTCGRPTASS
jgi:hypothetical protein